MERRRKKSIRNMDPSSKTCNFILGKTPYWSFKIDKNVGLVFKFFKF